MIAEGDLLWAPSVDRVRDANLTKFTAWLERERGLVFADYMALWRWSVDDVAGFWAVVWDYCEIISDCPPNEIVSGMEMPGAKWFRGSRVNYAEHLLRHEASATPDQAALIHSTEIRSLATIGWSELGARVRRLATSLREMGIQPGDRIVAYAPNIPETAIAMMASVAIGAIWSAAAPEFGARTVLDRFEQIKPRFAFVADGYSFNGKRFDRRDEIGDIVGQLPSVETLVWIDYAGFGSGDVQGVANIRFADLERGEPVSPEAFRYERVPFDHPLWILFSSGTTGKPKAIAHSHVGMVAEHLKSRMLSGDLKPGDRLFFYTTTGWMMWNSILSSLLCGAGAILYDGSPTFGGVDALWRIASEARANSFGASPTLVQAMRRAGARPGKKFDLSSLNTITVSGSPATPDVYEWFYENVKRDVWVSSNSGGTEICSGFVGGVSTQPVYAAEIQGPMLGVDVHAWSDDGRELIDQVGELVVLKPFPNMPLYFWGDEGDVRYRETYFSTFPGAWHHGDLIKFNDRGGCYIYGRSDATLNRFGVRIGTSEIYGIVNAIPGIADSLIVCCEEADGGFYMPMFVKTADGTALDDELIATIRDRLRSEASPRHIPDEIHKVAEIPYTLTGKKMEIPVRRVLMGTDADAAASRESMNDPALLDWFVAFRSHRA